MTTLLESLIEQDFGFRGNGHRWARSNKHDSLVIDRENQIWFWNSKGISGDAFDYLVKVRGYSRKDAENIVRNSIKIPKPVLENRKIKYVPYEKLVDILWRNGINYRNYWYNRCLRDDTIDRYRLGYYNGWYLIPLYEEGTFLNFQKRREEPKKRICYWYEGSDFSPVMLNSEILEFVDYVYIAEGSVDSILLNQEGLPSVSQTGGIYWNPRWNHLFEKIKRVYYIQDNDEAGERHAKVVAENIGIYKTKIVTLGDKEHYDSVDFFRDGRTSEELKEICKTQSQYLFERRRK